MLYLGRRVFRLKNIQKYKLCQLLFTEDTLLNQCQHTQANNSLGADCRKILVLSFKLLTAAQASRYAAGLTVRQYFKASC